ncbi:MAG: carbohydrate porin [Candidatus Omnitrophica bacterium]|nr:carbohydrate porin [Candidatus Omnitrophota bacterium]
MRICKKHCVIAVFVALCALTASSPAAGERASSDISWLESWRTQKTATGRWDGLRDKLEDDGITISCNYTTDIGGNPAGGIKQVAKYSGFLSLGIALDLQKIASIKGLALTVTNLLASGRDISAAIGTYYSPQQVYTSGAYYFGELDLSLSVMDDTMVFEAGRLFAGDLFAVSHVFQYYLTSAVDGRLAAIPSNIFFPHYRTAAWGTRATYQPNADWHVIAGIYNADPKVEKINNRGADFSFAMDEGYLAVGQITYKHAQNKEDPGSPGSVTAGAYYESSKFTDLTDSSKRWHGNYGLWAVADQMIWEGEWPQYEGPAHLRSGALIAERRRHPYHQQPVTPLDRPVGLTAWCGAVLAPNARINTQTYEIASGLVYQGLPPNRNRDVTALCFILGHFSEKLDGQTNEMIVELNHRFQLSQWFYLTPDIQCIINPDGRSDVDPALVLGFEASVNF